MYECFRGDDFEFEIEVRDQITGSLVNLSSIDHLTVSFRKPPADDVLLVKSSTNSAQISKGVNPALGIATVFLSGADTTALGKGAFEFDCQVTYADHTNHTSDTYVLMVKGDVSAP